MTALLTAVLPPQHASDHLLALPAAVDVEALARAWFPDARWVVAPVAEPTRATARPQAGARFRGMAQEVPSALPGEMSLGPGVTLRGPYPLTPAQTQAFDLPTRRSCAYAVQVEGAAGRDAPAQDVDHHDELTRAFPGGLPVGDELVVVQWLVAAARHARGAVLLDGAGVPVVPDPRSAVNLSLYSAYGLSPGNALALVRTVLVQARLAGSTTALDGPQEFWLRAETPYDGAVSVAFHRTESMPLVLSTVPWRDSGPFAYHVRWDPVPDDDYGVQQTSQLHSIARTRMGPVVARVAQTLQTAVAGIVVDEGGFMRDASYPG